MLSAHRGALALCVSSAAPALTGSQIILALAAVLRLAAVAVVASPLTGRLGPLQRHCDTDRAWRSTLRRRSDGLAVGAERPVRALRPTPLARRDPERRIRCGLRLARLPLGHTGVRAAAGVAAPTCCRVAGSGFRHANPRFRHPVRIARHCRRRSDLRPGLVARCWVARCLGASQYVRATTIYVLPAFLVVLGLLSAWRTRILAVLLAAGSSCYRSSSITTSPTTNGQSPPPGSAAGHCSWERTRPTMACTTPMILRSSVGPAHSAPMRRTAGPDVGNPANHF